MQILFISKIYAIRLARSINETKRATNGYISVSFEEENARFYIVCTVYLFMYTFNGIGCCVWRFVYVYSIEYIMYFESWRGNDLHKNAWAARVAPSGKSTTPCEKKRAKIRVDVRTDAVHSVLIWNSSVYSRLLSASVQHKKKHI